MPASHDQSPTASLLHRFLRQTELEQLLQRARQEDLGPAGDLTSELMIPPEQTAQVIFRARQGGCLAGGALLPTAALVYDPTLHVTVLKSDGEQLVADDEVAQVSGRLRSILALERVALNLLTHLSGIATLTAQYVAAVAGTQARICDTRKTLPGLRALEKYAVVCGGGVSHRMGLYDALLIKDNHLASFSLAELPGKLAELIAHAKKLTPPPKFIEVEVDRLEQLERVLPVGPDMVLLDNMPPEMLVQAVALRNRVAPRMLLEASGGVNLQTVAAIAATGVDRISVGALTHSAPALDIGLDMA